MPLPAPHKPTASVHWTEEEVLALKDRFPHLTDMELARRSGWTVWAVARALLLRRT